MDAHEKLVQLTVERSKKRSPQGITRLEDVEVLQGGFGYGPSSVYVYSTPLEWFTYDNDPRVTISGCASIVSSGPEDPVSERYHIGQVIEVRLQVPSVSEQPITLITVGFPVDDAAPEVWELTLQKLRAMEEWMLKLVLQAVPPIH